MFAANAAWLVCAALAFNLTRAAATITGPKLDWATTGSTRRWLINLAARISSSARRVVLHLPDHWPWQPSWETLFAETFGLPKPALI